VGLIFTTLGFEPLQQVDVDAKRYLLFDRSVEATSNGAEKAAYLGNVASIDIFIG